MVSGLIPGAFFVVLTWLFICLLITLYGRFIAGFISRKSEVRSDHLWRIGLWWGLTVVTIATLALSFPIPLGGATAGIVIIGLGIVFGIAGIALIRPKGLQWRKPTKSVSSFLIAAWLAFTYLAFKALGPVTNYDSGLYHLGAIKYAADYAAIPGLANLYFPFGYSNVQFPLAALLGNGPWDGIGYRLINGAILALALADLSSRLLNRRWSWGTFTLLFGLSAAFIPMVAMADDMVTSPTSDTSVMLLTLIAAGYLADAFQSHETASEDALTAITVAGLTVAFRPTMIIFALSVLVVGATFILRKRRALRPKAAPWIVTAALLSLLASVSLLRDRTLSGWLFYPLSSFPLQVPWLAEDPSRWRIGTLAAARDPSTQDGFQTANSYDWIPNWIARLPHQWEPWFLLVGLVIATAVVVFAWRAQVMRGVGTRLLLALVPSSLALLIWFLFSPPSFRFIWGPVLVLVALPLGIATAQLHDANVRIMGLDTGRGIALIASAVCIFSVTVFSAVERNQFDTISQERRWQLGPLVIDYPVTPVPRPPVSSIDLGNGLTIQTPVDGDQCWDNYPLCAYYTGQPIAPRGPSIQDGFNYG